MTGQKRLYNYTGTYVRQDEEDERRIWFRFNTNGIDRHRTVLEPKGADRRFFDGLFLWGHDSGPGMFSGPPKLENILGNIPPEEVRMVSFRRTEKELGDPGGKALEGPVNWADEENPRAELARRFVVGGFLKRTSVGFLPRESEMREVAGREVRVFIKWELLEVSLIPIPSNPEVDSFLRSLIQAESGESQPLTGGGWSYDLERGVWLLTRGDALLAEADSGMILDLLEKLKERVAEEQGPPPEGADIGPVIRRATQGWLTRQRIRRSIRAGLRLS